MSLSPVVGIVLVNFKQDQFTRSCIRSLRDGKYQNYHIMVVDNQSCGSLKDLAGFDEKVYIIESETNTGFCGGNNIGIKHFLSLKADYILILNTDTLSHQDFLEKLVAAGEASKRKAVITSKIYYDHDRSLLWYAGGYISYICGLGKHYGFREHDQGRFEKTRQVDYVTGCCMLVPSDVYRVHGLMKESLFMYMDDTEYSMRLKNSGVPIIYEPRAVLYHRVGGGLSMAEYKPFYLYHITRNRIHVTNSIVYRGYLFCVNIFYSILRLFFFALSKNNPHKRFQMLAIVRGLKDSVRPEKKTFFHYSWV